MWSTALRAKAALLSLLVLAVPAVAEMERAVLIRPGFIYVSPDKKSPKLREAERGRTLDLVEARGTTKDWLHVSVNFGPGQAVTGWMLDKGIVGPGTPNGDRIVFGEAVDSEAEASRRRGRKGAADDAGRLYYRVYDIFPNSPLAGEALYRAADIRWQIDRDDVFSRPAGRQPEARLRPEIDTTLMKLVQKKFPNSKWAELAEFAMLDNKICGDWQGLAKCPEKEANVYEEFAREHPSSAKAPEALYLAAYRQAALIELYREDGKLDKSVEARQKALALAQKVAAGWSQSDWGARAQRLAYLVEQGVPVYTPVVE